jgi:hypothetical protein
MSGMAAGLPGGLFHLFNANRLAQPTTLQFAQIRSVPGTQEEDRGHERPKYGYDIVILGGAEHPNVPCVSSYLRGQHGEHIVAEPGAVCLVGFLGGMRQPIILGFVHLPTPDGAFGSTRPRLGQGDRMITQPGQQGFKGQAARYFSRTGLILDQAAAECKRVMDPTLDRITEFCRDHRIVTSGGRQVWNEAPTRGREILFRRMVFSRAKTSPSGTGPYVDTQEGTVPRLTEAGAPLDGLDVYCKDVNGQARLTVDEDGNTDILLGGTLTIDATRQGYEAATLTSTTANLPIGGLTGKTFNISVNNLFTYSFTIFTDSLEMAAIANEINDNCPEILASIDTDGKLVIQTRKTGPDASLTVSGTGATLIGITGSDTGGEGSPTDPQDINIDLRGDFKLAVGEKSENQRKIEVRITEAGRALVEGTNAKVDVDVDAGTVDVEAGDTKLSLDKDNDQVTVENKAGCKITMKSDGTCIIEGTTVELGEGATEGLVKKADLQLWATAHTHPTGVGPSGGGTPIEDTAFSTKVFQEA